MHTLRHKCRISEGREWIPSVCCQSVGSGSPSVCCQSKELSADNTIHGLL
jgi:hypothetical protein